MASRYDNWLEGDCGVDEASEAQSERIDELVTEYEGDDAKLREAEEMVAGTFDGSHYTDVTLALFDLFQTQPENLLGSDLLAKLYALAKVEYTAMRAELVRMATDEAEREADEAAEMRDFARRAAE